MPSKNGRRKLSEKGLLTPDNCVVAFIDLQPQMLFVYWRQSLVNGVYSVPGSLIRAADGSRARFVGHRPGTEVRWQVNTHLWFQGDFGIFYAGRFLKETKPGCNLNYWALCAGYKF